MSTYLLGLLWELAESVLPVRAHHLPEGPRATRRLLRVETLEDRLVLSLTAPGAPGDAYVLAGQDSDPAGPIYRWSQPGGPGSHITLTYSYSNLLDGSLGGGLSPATIKVAIQEALSRWAAVAPIDFVEVPDSGPPPSTTDYDPTGKAVIRFGDMPIDGPYNILAYGYYPGSSGLSGDVVFDSGEHWAVNSAQGIDLVEVAEHEIGHALGMAHEPPPSQGGLDAIMNPVYVGRFHGLGTSFLFQDDINGIQALYGAGTGSVQPLTASSPSLPADLVPSYVSTLYRKLLARSPSQAEIGIWATINYQDGQNAVEQGIERSTETRTDQVNAWYRQFLGRSASALEVQGWVTALAQGASEEQVMSTILGSREFYTRAQMLQATGTGSANERFVKALYQVTLHRNPSTSEMTTWLGVLQVQGPAAVAQLIVTSPEYRSIAVLADYTTFLGRVPSSAERSGWTTSAASLQDIREALLLSGEFLARV
jgi:hypothetical protein